MSLLPYRQISFAVFMLTLFTAASGFKSLRWPFPSHDFHASSKDDPGSPVYVTPFIEKGEIKQAQAAAAVHIDGVNTTSYAGFFTVNPTYNSNLFFWYFPSENNPSKDPVLLWLQGGPGGSSLFGLFAENGPFLITENMAVKMRQYSWTKKFSMLYIDNPVGTGFSFTKNDAGYATTEAEVAENLFQALKQFFTMFPTLQDVDFYATGESYAGKYVPALAYRILEDPSSHPVYIRGIAVGDGWSDPITMVTAYSDLMFNTGLLDERQREYGRTQVAKVVELIKAGEYVKADEALEVYYSYAANETGGVNVYNYLYDKNPEELGYYGKFVNQNSIRRAIHVGSLPYQSGEKAATNLQGDIMQSATRYLAKVMDRSRVMLYNGQLDIIVGAPLTEIMLYNLKWSYADEYKLLPRKVWRVDPSDPEPAGYVRQVHDFYQVIVRGGGHLLPFDQPERSFDMIQRFVLNKPF